MSQLEPPCVPAGPQPLFPVSSPLPGNTTFLGRDDVAWGRVWELGAPFLGSFAAGRREGEGEQQMPVKAVV